MKLLRHLQPLPVSAAGCIATIGNFDGLHRGHQQVIRLVQAKAAECGLPATVVSFEPLPAEYFRTPPPTRILPLRDKLHQLDAMGVEQFVCLSFRQALAEMEAETFVQSILLDGLRVKCLVVGDDFRFGRQRRGDYQLLTAMGAQQGMQVIDIPTFLQADERVSSTWVRKALAAGDLATTTDLLGMPYGLSGRIRHGDKRGRTIGFPTLNLRIPENVALRKGVYAVRIKGLGEQSLTGVANLGTRPTVNGLESRLEVHVFNFAAQVYQQHVRVEPVHFIRDEQRFSSLDALQQQITKDVEQAKSLLHTEHLP